MNHSTTPPTEGTPVVLVLVDHHDGVVRSPTWEALTAARDLGEVHAVWLGRGLDTDALAEYGVAVVHRVDAHGRGAAGPDGYDDGGEDGDGDGVGDVATPEEPLPAAVAHALADVAGRCGADTVLLTSTPTTREVAALVAHRLEAGLVVDATAVHRGPEGHVVAATEAFGSTWAALVEVVRDRAVVALRPYSVAPVPVGTARPVEVRQHRTDVPAGRAVPRVVWRTPGPATRPELATADVVVAGGRGTEGDFALVEELADLLGGTVGATGVATHEGWIGREATIGQSGVTVAPRLYVGVGVSGAVHHRVGMEAARTIVAVNSDPDAPIFEIADVGVVGDLFTVLPQLNAEIRRLRA